MASSIAEPNLAKIGKNSARFKSRPNIFADHKGLKLIRYGELEGVQAQIANNAREAREDLAIGRLMAVPAENLNPDVLMMQPTQNWNRGYDTEGLGTTEERRVLVQ